MADPDVNSGGVPLTPGSATDARMNRDSIKKGFSDFRKFAGTNFFRAKQVGGVFRRKWLFLFCKSLLGRVMNVLCWHYLYW